MESDMPEAWWSMIRSTARTRWIIRSYYLLLEDLNLNERPCSCIPTHKTTESMVLSHHDLEEGVLRYQSCHRPRETG